MTAAWISVVVALASPQSFNRPPTIKIEIEGDRFICERSKWGQRHRRDFWPRVRVTVDDPDGDRVSARLVLGQTTFAMAPIVDELPPVTRELSPNACFGGINRFVVHATESGKSAAAALTARAEDYVEYCCFDESLRSGQSSRDPRRVLDVDGDDGPEIAIADPKANHNGVVDAGALVLFSATRLDASGLPERRNLVSSTPTANGRVGVVGDSQFGGSRDGNTFDQVDLDGDGVLDVIALSAEGKEEFHVWFGGWTARPSRPDDARLVTANKVDYGTSGAQWLRFADVTGDGITDVLAAAPQADVGTTGYAGAIFVWAGGPAMTGTLQPTATLQLATPQFYDLLCGDDWPLDSRTQSLLLHDVTGDGVVDVIGAAPIGDNYYGVIGVWKGGPGIAGAVVPTAELHASSPPKWGRLGYAEYAAAVRFGDVDGDGIDDLISVYNDEWGDSKYPPQILVWSGGASLTGNPAPRATLIPAVTKVSYSYSSNGEGRILVDDLTGDGIDDVIACSPGVNLNGPNLLVGAVFLWQGGPGLAGTLSESALFRAGAASSFGSGGIALADLDGDRVRDLVAVSPGFSTPAIDGTGAAHFWKGGVAWTGTPPPTAEMAGLSTKEYLGSQWRITDLTGDGIDDLLLVRKGPWGRQGKHRHVGGDVGLRLFKGGPSLLGSVAPHANLRVEFAATRYFRLGPTADVTGDGIADVIATDDHKGTSLGIVTHDGCVQVWSGGPLPGTHRPIATSIGGPNDYAFHKPWTPVLGDVTGDGVLDCMLPAAGGAWRGGLHVYAGGTSLRGPVVPIAFLERAVPENGDICFFNYSTPPVLLGDFDRNGIDDVATASGWIDVAGKRNVGALLWFPDGRPLPGGGAVELLPKQVDVDHEFGE